MENPKFKVCVKCFTFNQAKFIIEAMNGFCIQQTNFPYVCCIVDDASTDGEQDVITQYVKSNFHLPDADMVFQKETDYASIIFAKHNINTNCFFAVLLLKENHYGKKSKMPYINEWWQMSQYAAACEGDDYWTNSQKLQKAVDFLDANKDYSVFCHRFQIYHNESGILKDDDKQRLFVNNPHGISFQKGFKHFMTQTLCAVYRIEDLDEYYSYSGMHTDAVLGHFLLKKGKGYCINEYMGVYRLNELSVWSEKDFRTKSLWNYKMYKQLYEYEEDADSRKAYYSQFASAFLATRGTILFTERFEFLKMVSVPYFLAIKIYRFILRKNR